MPLITFCNCGGPSGYTLAVTLEIADATLGGLAFGVGMTTYSHKVVCQSPFKFNETILTI